MKFTLPAPYNVAWMQWFLEAHAVPLIETYVDGRYRRTIRLTHDVALVDIAFGTDTVDVDVDARDVRDEAEAMALTRAVLRLDLDTSAADVALATDPALAPLISEAPGIRVPGCFDAGEVLLRTMIGQQISLGAAATHTARLVGALGESVDVAGETWRLFPTPAAIAERGGAVLTGPAKRVAAIVEAAATLAAGGIDLDPARSPDALESDLLALRGVGPWTARYVTMRVAGHPDVLLTTDLVVRQGAALLELDLSDTERWSPWRSYVSMHLWRVALEARRNRRE